MYNLQSGMHRQRFPPRLTKQQAKQAQQDDAAKRGKDGQAWARGYGKHTAAVTGLHVDSLNRTVISSGLDGKIKVRE